MASPASIMGHPIHPMLIPFPIALWVFSLVADLLYLWRGNTHWPLIAFYSLLAGCLAAVVAAIFGFIDYLSIQDKQVVKVANWHARFNVLALVLFAASWYLRTDKGSDMVNDSLTVPIALSVVGVIAVTISGWLGGELVFKHGVAVNPQRDTPPEEAAKARVS
ncbi:MAG TPA: DUF2231 domain-containing protein [Pyrinomonadaceae bacterium]|nr:DUF2231 domain-containing protein [Pyrinomonadaceae bacterium]